MNLFPLPYYPDGRRDYKSKKMNNKPRVTRVSFLIPDSPVFPSSYKGGTVEVGVWPPLGGRPSIVDTEGGPERLEDWTVNNILLGFIEGAYSEVQLREDDILIKISTADGEIILNTFGQWGNHERG